MPNWAYNEIRCQNEHDFSRLKECVLTQGNMDFKRIIPMPDVLEKMPGCSSSEHIRAIAYYLGCGQPISKTEVCQAIHKEYPNVRFLSNNKVVMFANATTKRKKRLNIDIEIADKISDASQDTDAIKAEIQRYANGRKNMPNFYCFNTYEEYGKTALRCLLLYGCFDWYTWCTSVWGTKWNASETNVSEEDFAIYFETAWSPVVELMCHLSKKLRIPLYMQYAEEQFTAFAGEAVFVDGHVIEQNDYGYGEPGLYDTACRLIDPDQLYHRCTDDNDIITYYDDWDEDEEPGTKAKFEALQPRDVSSEMYANFMQEDYSEILEPSRNAHSKEVMACTDTSHSTN